MTVICYFTGLAWLPLLLALTLSATMLITYYISVYYGHVNTELPLISSTGALPPESCIFAQGLNISAFLGTLCVYIWYRITWQQTDYMGSKQPRKLLRITVILGSLSTLGLTLVGNFQNVNVEIVHSIGATMAFAGTTIYIFLVTHICRKYLSYRPVYWGLRLCIGITSAIVLLIFVVCHQISRQQFHGPEEELLLNRLPQYGGYEAYVCGSSFEWFMGFLVITFFLSWAPEFRKYSLKLPESVESAVKKDEKV